MRVVEKVLFVTPGDVIPKGTFSRITPSMAILQLAPVVSKSFPNIEISIIESAAEGDVHSNPYDINIKGLTDEEWETQIRRIKPQIIFISLLHTCEYYEAMNIARIAKKVLGKDNVLVVIGGHHATFTTEYILGKHPEIIDTVVKGRGEEAIEKIIRQFRDGKQVSGIIDEREARNSSPHLPDYSLLDPEGYPTSMGHWPCQLTETTFTYLFTAQGDCPYDCDMCLQAEMSGGKRCFYTKDQILVMIESIKSQGFGLVVLEDDNFALQRQQRFEMVCQTFSEMDMPWLWEGGVFPPAITREKFQICAESGCRSMFIPFDAGSEYSLRFHFDKYRKWDVRTMPDLKKKFEEIGQWAEEFGIPWYTSIVIFPEDDYESVKDLAFFLKNCEALAVYFFWFHPFPPDTQNWPIMPGREWQKPEGAEYWKFVSQVVKGEISEEAIQSLAQKVNPGMAILPSPRS